MINPITYFDTKFQIHMFNSLVTRYLNRLADTKIAKLVKTLNNESDCIEVIENYLMGDFETIEESLEHVTLMTV